MELSEVYLSYSRWLSVLFPQLHVTTQAEQQQSGLFVIETIWQRLNFEPHPPEVTWSSW